MRQFQIGDGKCLCKTAGGSRGQRRAAGDGQTAPLSTLHAVNR